MMARPSVLLLLLLPSLHALLTPPAIAAQAPHHAQLSEAETEQIRESAIFPVERVKIYTRLIEDRAGKIKDLTGRAKSGQRVLKLESDLEDLTALMDEIGENLDQYSDRHSDIRSALKVLNEVSPRWLNILRALPGEPGFDLSRKEAIESGEELADQAERLMHEQDDYFATHKDEKGQERDDANRAADQQKQ